MAVRIEDLSGPRNIGLLQSLNRADWKSINKIPQDPMAKLTREEAQRLKNERGETYNGPYRLEEGDIHLAPPSPRELFKLTLINGPESLEKTDSTHPVLTEVSKLTQAQTVFSSDFKEIPDTGEFYSNGDRF